MQLKLFQAEAGAFLDQVEATEGLLLPRQTLMSVVRKAMAMVKSQDDRASPGELAGEWYRWARRHDPWGRRVEPATLLRRMADKLPYWAREQGQGRGVEGLPGGTADYARAIRGRDPGGFEEDAKTYAQWIQGAQGKRPRAPPEG